MCNIRVEAIINSEKRYIEGLYPVMWTAFISNAKNFSSIQEARENLNTRFSQLSESLDHNVSFINDIKLITIENGKIISEEFYIRR